MPTPSRARDVGEHEHATRTLSVEPKELLAREAGDRLDAVDDRVAADLIGAARGHFGRLEVVVQPREGKRGGILPEVVDDIAVETRREDPTVLSDSLAAALLVDLEQPLDESADDADAGTLPAAALVVGDDRRRDVEFGREIGL